MVGDSVSFGSNLRLFIDENDPGGTTPIESRVEVVHGEAEVVNPRSTARDEPSDRGVGGFRLEQLDERVAGLVARDPSTIGVGELRDRHLEEVVEQRTKAVEVMDRDAAMSDARAST